MPSGEIKQIIKDYNVEGVDNEILDNLPSDKLEDFHPDEQEKIEALLKKPKEEPLTDEEKKNPLTIPPDIHRLLKGLGNKGGIKIDNCQELNLIRDLIHQSKLDVDMKLSMYKLLELMCNFGNLWILHYNTHC